MIAWKLTTDFNEAQHLFSDTLQADYLLETYICSCGHKQFIVKHSQQNIGYQCQECDNTKFYSANSAWRNITHFVYQHLDLELSYEYDIQSNSEAIRSLYVTRIPQDIDFSSQNVIYGKKAVYTLSLTSSGDIKENYSLRFDQKILSQLKENLVEYINADECFNVPKPSKNRLTLKIASFFLKNRHLKDYEFYYWEYIPAFNDKDIYIVDALNHVANHPKAKSVKKALYNNYVFQMENTQKFDPTFVESFCMTIKDVNILVELLNLRLEFSKYSNVDKDDLKQMLVFLKSHYTEKQLLRLFRSEEFSSNHYLFRDAVREFIYAKELVETTFRKVPCRVNTLHDELVRCVQEERHRYMFNKKLSYTEYDMKPCIEIDKYQVRLPKSGKDLFIWAETLHNCMAGYFEMIVNRETVIYCFFQSDILKSAVEVSDGKIIQASGKYNSRLSDEERGVMNQWLKLFFCKTKNGVDSICA